MTSAQEVWKVPASSSWSVDANWTDGSAPVPGGAAGLELVFTAAGNASYTATNDLGDPFVFQRLAINSTSKGPITIASAPGNALSFGGVTPEIRLSGYGSAVISSPIRLTDGAGGRITNLGYGNLTISGDISETGGSAGLIISGAHASPDLGSITLSGAGSYSGGVTLDSGTLRLTNPAALGTGTLTVNDGNLRFSAGTFTNNVSLNSTLSVASSDGAILGGVISSSTPQAGLSLRSNTSLTLTGASTYAGPTTVDVSLTPTLASLGGGQLTFSGNGSAVNSSAFHVNAGGRLRIDAHESGASNRIGDTAPVTLRNGELIFIDPTSNGGAKSETIGVLGSAGYSTVTLSAGSGQLQLNTAGLNRVERGTILFRGIGTGSGNARLVSTDAPQLSGSGTGVQTPIIPWAISDGSATGAGAGFVTYSAAGGIRGLSSTEYTDSWPSSAVVPNVQFAGTRSNTLPRTINSLFLRGGTINGTGVITVASGAVLGTNNTSISNSLSFGAVEANIFTTGTMSVSGVISGSGGLTKSGAGTLALSGNNTFTGPLTINAGIVSFTALSGLGTDSSAIVINGNDAGLEYRGAGTVTLTRDLQVNTGLGVLSALSSTDTHLVHTGTISGTGGLRVFSSTGQKITLAGENSYTGPTLLDGGEVIINSDAAFGNGGTLNLGNGTILRLEGAWESSRRISVSSFPTIFTNGFDATLSGILTGTGSLTKAGAGTLVLTGASPFSGSLNINGGTVRLQGAGQLASTSYAVAAAGSLVLDNSAGGASDRINDASMVQLNRGELRLEGNATTTMEEVIGGVGPTNRSVGNKVTLTAPGNAGTILRIGKQLLFDAPGGTYPVASPSLLIRGDNLGGAPGSGFSRVIIDNPPAAGALVPGVVVDSSSTGEGDSFAVYDSTVDAAGIVGLRPLRPHEYATGAVLQNQSNGGATTDTANYLAGAGTTVSGTTSTVNSLTLESGGALTLTSGQTLNVTSGRFLSQSGDSPAVVTGGTINTGSLPADFHTTGNLSLSSRVQSGSDLLIKRGTGTLTISGDQPLPGTLIVNEGTLAGGGGNALAGTTISLEPSGTLALQAPAQTVGSLAGLGNIVLESGVLTVGSLSTPMTFAGIISGAGGVTIVGGGDANAQRSLTGNNTFTGPLTLQSGQFLVGPISGMGQGSLVFDGGSIATSSSVTLGQPIVLTKDLLLAKGQLTLAPGADASGPGAIVQAGEQTLTIQRPVAAGGGLRIERGATTAGNVVISGAEGALTAGAEVRLKPSGFLSVNNTTAYSGGAGGRLPDAAAIHLQSAEFDLSGSANTSTIERVGALHVEGLSQIRLTPGSGAGVELAASSLSRTNRGAIVVRFTGQLGGSLGSAVARLSLDTAPTGMVGGILPYAIGMTSNSIGFLTHDASSGLRLLGAGELVSSLSGATSSSNVHLTVGGSNSENLSINSLALKNVGVGGTGRLDIASGAILTDGTTSISNALEFGAREAHLILNGGNFAGLTLGGELTGSGGLTISGSGLVKITGTNNITEPLTLNGNARISVSKLSDLGPASSEILINGDDVGAGFQFEQPGTLTVPHNIRIEGGYAAFAVRGSSSDRMVLGGTISGEGGIHITHLYGIPNQASTGTVVLQDGNTYAGTTYLEGAVAISSDTAFGAGGPLVFGSSGSIRLEGPWTTNRSIQIKDSGLAVIHTNGFDAILNGPIGVSSGELLQSGPGTLNLTKQTPVRSLTISGGTVRLTEQGAVSTFVTASNGGEFLIDNTAEVAPRNFSTLTLKQGSYVVKGNATTGTNVRVSTLNSQGYGNTITLTTPGVAPTVQEFTSYQKMSVAHVLFRGDALGGGPEGAYTRIRFSSPPSLKYGIIPGATVDTGATGGGSSYATYDSTSDAVGVIGVRALKLSEYASGAEIRNASNGGGVPADANFLASGAVLGGGTENEINTLTFAPGSSVTLDANQTLRIKDGSLLVQPGGSGAVLSGGTIAMEDNGQPFNLLGAGDFVFASKLSGTNSLAKHGPGELKFGGQIGSSGRIQLYAGTLKPQSEDSLQSVSVELWPDAVLDVRDSDSRVDSISGDGEIQLGNRTLKIGNLSGSPTDFQGRITGSGGITITRNDWLRVGSPVAYQGKTLIERDAKGAIGGSSTLTLTGAGSILASKQIEVNGGSRLVLSNASGTPESRIGTMPLKLNNSTIELVGNGRESITQNAGVLTFSGASHVVVSADNSATADVATRFHFQGLSRQERGAVVFNLNRWNGQGTVGVNVSQDLSSMLIGDGTSAAKRGILPYAVAMASYSTGIELVTVEAGGVIRPLTASEQSNTLVAGTNVSLTTDTTLNSSITVNALRLDSHDLTGTGTLRLASGVLTATSGIVVNPIDLGDTEGHFYASGGPTLSGPISGTNGLTLTQAYENTNAGFGLFGQNTFTGPLTLNGGIVKFGSAANFGAGDSPIIMNDATLRYSSGAPLTLDREIQISGSVASFDLFNAQRLTLAGAISGPGALSLSGDFALTGANSYEGYTRVNGKLTFGGDTVFGNSPLVLLDTGYNGSKDTELILTGLWVTSREVRLRGGASARIDTAGFDAHLNGVLASDAYSPLKLIKAGEGTLTISDLDQYTALLQVDGGTLVLKGDLGTGLPIAVSAGGTLEAQGRVQRAVNVAGTLSAGTNSGALHVNDLAFSDHSNLALELAAANAYERLQVTGGVTLNGTVELALSLSNGFDPSDFVDVFTLILNDGTDAIAGRFTHQGEPVDENDTLMFGGQEFRLTYQGGDGNDVVLFAVPEPGAVSLLAAGALMLGLRRRRRSRVEGSGEA